MKKMVWVALMVGALGFNQICAAEMLKVKIGASERLIDSKSLSVGGVRLGAKAAVSASAKKSERLGVHVEDGPLKSKKGTIHIVSGGSKE
jgi:hypothetical protein